MEAKPIAKAVVTLIVVMSVGGLVRHAIDSLRGTPVPTVAPDSAQPEVQKQKDIEAAKQTEAAASAERLAVLGVVGKTYDAMRNQQSMTVSSVGVIHTAKVMTACMEYASQNGFGGMNRGHATWQLKQGGAVKFAADSASSWNRDCTHKDYVDYTDLGRSLLKKMKDHDAQ
ncbi:hypothetical protein [Burkholderia contaminans]|uniref:hypothetical protein n=1 Tax=Burkholderia contaminans TaxID=488447 RepID=UPI000F58B071|nr:hypothetical protein [Burkholderia contaminans]RQT40587.1 hypothetical protein DF036_02970 [Burkholderia contaminans]VWD38640.1 hypothetical protein BCO18442_05184 [Burkholderia contaminans]